MAIALVLVTAVKFEGLGLPCNGDGLGIAPTHQHLHNIHSICSFGALSMTPIVGC